MKVVKVYLSGTKQVNITILDGEDINDALNEVISSHSITDHVHWDIEDYEVVE
jgi:hypothetical protein